MFLSLQQSVILGGVVLAVGLGGFALHRSNQPAPPPVTAEAPAPAPPPAPQPAPDQVPELTVPPAFDVVRIATDGGALVAGAASPGASVVLRVDGDAVVETVADAAGQFVVLFRLDPAEAPQMMTLESRLRDGGTNAGGDTVVLAPRPALGVPEAAPTAEPAAEPRETDTDIAAIEPPPQAPPLALAEAPADTLTEAGELPAPGLQTDTAPAPSPPPPPRPETAMRVAPPPVLPAPDSGAPFTTDLADDPEDDPADDPASPPDTAPLLPPAFVLRESGAVEISAPPPSPTDAVVIDAISYSDTGAVQISGRAGRDDPQARVQLYLDNQPLARTQSARGAWTIEVPDLEPGLYTLRVDQLGADGRVATRFETPFQRAEPDQLRRPPARPDRDSSGAVQLITVQPGNSLWRISREHYGAGVRYVQIYRANEDQIRDPDWIYPGQVFVLPD